MASTQLRSSVSPLAGASRSLQSRQRIVSVAASASGSSPLASQRHLAIANEEGRSKVIANVSLGLAAPQPAQSSWLGMLELFFTPNRPSAGQLEMDVLYGDDHEDQHSHPMYFSHLADRLAVAPARGTAASEMDF